MEDSVTISKEEELRAIAIKNGNRLIKTFMNWESNGYEFTFHLNWGLVHQVIDRIEKLEETPYPNKNVKCKWCITIESPGRCRIHLIGSDAQERYLKTFRRSISNNKIMAVWETLVEFINWYNSEDRKEFNK